MIGYHRMPVDEGILDRLKEFDFDLEYALRCIEANKHNHITTTYYLLLKKHLKAGNASSSDLSSPSFDYSSIQPFKRTDFQNKHTFFGSIDEGPVITLEPGDIHLNQKVNKAFCIQPKSSKHQESKKSANDHRRSNNFFGRDKKN